MKQLVIDLPAETHKRFKLHCVAQGIDMAGLVRQMINTELEKAEKIEKKK